MESAKTGFSHLEVAWHSSWMSQTASFVSYICHPRNLFYLIAHSLPIVCYDLVVYVIYNIVYIMVMSVTSIVTNGYLLSQILCMGYVLY